LTKKLALSQENLIKTFLQQKKPSIKQGINVVKTVALMLVLLIVSCVSTAYLVSAVSEDSWASKAPMQQPRGALGVAAVNGKIYAIGGSAQDVLLATTKMFLSTNEEYDPATNAWAFKNSMPTPRAALAVVAYKNKIYCIGGRTSDGLTGVNEVYDPATDTWETKTAMPTARSFLSANVVNGKIYLIGDLTEVYDPATDSWATKAPIPFPAGIASAVFDNKIYKFGSKLQIYDPATDTWSEGTPKPSSVGGVLGAGVTVGDMAPKRIYALGDRVGVYDPANDTWTLGAVKSKSQTDFGVAVVNDLFYAVGGYSYDYLYAMYGLGHFESLALNDQYTPSGYGTILPEVVVVSPEKRVYNSSSLSLIFTVDRSALWFGYDLDGQETVAIEGNTTITALANGVHNVTVSAKDEFGNVGASETVYFTITEPEPEPFPTLFVVTVSVSAIALVGASLIIYFKKRKH
jgi:N-acetylneuraminic acid mutarotase